MQSVQLYKFEMETKLLGNLSAVMVEVALQIVTMVLIFREATFSIVYFSWIDCLGHIEQMSLMYFLAVLQKMRM
jgi:hypothetical protein